MQHPKTGEGVSSSSPEQAVVRPEAVAVVSVVVVGLFVDETDRFQRALDARLRPLLRLPRPAHDVRGFVHLCVHENAESSRVTQRGGETIL